MIPDDRWNEPYMSKEELRHQIGEGVVFWGYEDDGELIDESQFKAIANLPPKEILLGQLVGLIAAPATGMVNVIAAPIRNLAYALDDLRKKKEAA